MARPPRNLGPDDVRPRCPSSWLPASTQDVRPRRTVVGQKRALESLRLGLTLRSPGYNIFVTGVPGTGRSSITTAMVRRLVPVARRQLDYAYVHNFDEPDRPVLLRLPAGQAARLRRDMDDLLRRLRRILPRAVNAGAVGKRRDRMVSRLQVEERRLLHRFEAKARRAGFVVTRRDDGNGGEELDLALLMAGRSYAMERLDDLRRRGRLTARTVRSVRDRYERLRAELEGVMRRGRSLEERLSREVDHLEDRRVEDIIRRLVERIEARHEEPWVRDHLRAVRERLLEDIDLFVEEDDRPPAAGEPRHGDAFSLYRVNVVQEARHRDRPPVAEAHPTYRNLFGTIERVERPGGAITADFHAIRGGALLRADGGVLLLDAADLLEEPYVFRALRRVLRSGRLEIQDPESAMSMAPSALKPEPIELDVKVVLVGDEGLYEHVWDMEEGFDKLFKVKAEFDDTIPFTRSSVAAYTGFLARLCRDDGLPPFGRGAIGRLVDECRRHAGMAGLMSARFSELADLARESAHVARARRRSRVDDRHVAEAVAARDRRQNLLEEKMLREIHEGVIRVHTTGARVGCVNGLVVIDVGSYAFGKPSRVTSTVAPGDDGLVNIEREAHLSGRMHDKGVLILAGLLRRLFARDEPLSLVASLCMEQSYAGVDGDSASLAECLAILSALAEVPLAQRFAVTGALDQHGAVLAVGGVTEKVEGFFRVARPRGGGPAPGVVLPRDCARDLMVGDDVARAVARGRFEVRPVATVEEALSILAAPLTAAEVLRRGAERLKAFRRVMERRHRG